MFPSSSRSILDGGHPRFGRSAGAQEDSSAPPETLLGLPASLVARMQSDTLAWQAVGGILIGAGASLLPAPCSLLPYPWPSELFEQSRALAVPFNALVDRVARDVDWLHAATRSVVKQDAFTGRLLQLSESVHAEGPTQPLQLGIYRSDYMVHQPPGGAPPLLRQVERARECLKAPPTLEAFPAGQALRPPEKRTIREDWR